jgi:murein DD-endopeptidase MepM/ murein hydrolase activator NlpD
MPLRIVGVDNPGGGLQQQASALQKTVSVSDVTDQALQNAQRAQQQTTELIKGEVEIQSQVARQNQAVAEKTPSSDFLFNAVKTAGALFDKYQKIDESRKEKQQKYNEEAKEERQKFNLANASQEVRDSMTDVRNVFDKLGREKGTEVVRQRFQEIMLKYNDISPETHKELTTYFYSALDDIDREQWNEGQRNRRELQEAKVSQATYDLKQRQATRLAELRNGPQRDNKEFTDKVIGDIVTDSDRAAREMGFDELQSTQFKGNILRLIAENTEESAQTRASAATKLEDLTAFQTKAAAIAASGLPLDIQAKMMDAARLQHNQNGSTDLMTDIDLMKQNAERKGLEKQLKQFEVEGIIEKGEASGLSKFALTQRALSYIENPADKFKLEALKTVQPLEYAELRNHIEHVESLIKSVRTAQPKLATLSTQISKLQGRIEEINALKQMDAKALNALKQAGQSVDFTDEAAVVAQLAGLNQEYTTLVGPASQSMQQLANMGVLMSNDGQYTLDPGSLTKLEAAQQASAQNPPKPVNFNQGGAASQATATAPVSDLVKMSVGNTQVSMPFLPKDLKLLQISSHYGMRTNPVTGQYKLHDGIDIAAPTGTPVTSLKSGKVIRSEVNGSLTSGYGNYIEVEHADGTVTGYAHLDARNVKVGQTVAQGQKIGTVGSTGGSTGPHLHLSVFPSKTGQGVDPISFLASIKRETGQVAARGMGLPPHPPSSTGRTGIYRKNNEAAFLLAQDKAPAGSLPLATGGYIFQGRVHLPKGTYEQMAAYSGRPLGQPLSNTPGGQGGSSVATSKQFNSKLPMVGTRYSANIKDYGKIVNDPTANYGYESLAKDKDFARALAGTANRLGIPAVWLADIMAFESTYENKTHNPRAINDDGAVGLIQFYPGNGLSEVAQAMGTNESVAADRLRNMTAAQQMRWVEFYMNKRIQEFGPIKRMDDALALIFGGLGLAQKSDAQRASSSDGGISFAGYLDQVGHHVGRKYHHAFVRGSDKPRTHTTAKTGCATCSAMHDSGNFTPHKGVTTTTTVSRKKTSTSSTSSSGRSPLSIIRTGSVSSSRGYASRRDKD